MPPGDLVVRCDATGLLACLAFKDGGAVRGTLERVAGGGASYAPLGTFGGSWRGAVSVECPSLVGRGRGGMEGVERVEGVEGGGRVAYVQLKRPPPP